MPRYEITGSFNGSAIKPTTVEADTVDDARSKAVAKGVKVKSVVPLGTSAELAWHEGDVAPPPLPSAGPKLAVGTPRFEQEAMAAFYSRFLATEYHLKGIYDRLGWLLLLVGLLAMPMILAALWFLLLLIGTLGAGAAFLKG